MNKQEMEKLQLEFDETQKEIRKLQKELGQNTTLLKNISFIKKRTQLFYKSYCIDCTLKGEWAVSYEKYNMGV